MCIDRIGPGHVGIKVDYAGSNRGVENIPIVTGWVFFWPMSSTVIEYPTNVQTANWSVRTDDGKAIDDSININTREGVSVGLDVSLSYQMDPARVPHFYGKFLNDDMDAFTHGFLRNVVRDSFAETGSHYTVEDIYGDKKEEFMHTVRDKITNQPEIKDLGIVIVQGPGLIDKPRVPDNIASAMQNKVQAIQKAEQARNELATQQAEAAKNVADAQGRADAMVVQAKGEAQSNQIKAASITPNLIEWRKLDNTNLMISKWNGEVPHIQAGNNGMLLNIPNQ